MLTILGDDIAFMAALGSRQLPACSVSGLAADCNFTNARPGRAVVAPGV
jgi:hypothetical protein